MSASDEILSRIEQEHQAGQHFARMAGCSFCDRLYGDAPANDDDLAAAAERVLAGEEPMPAGQTDSSMFARTTTDDRSPGPRLADELAAMRAVRTARSVPVLAGEVSGGETLGDVALADAQAALDAAVNTPPATQATVHALVGVVRALAGIEQAIREASIENISVLEASREEDGAKIVPRPAPDYANDDPPDGAA